MERTQKKNVFVRYFTPFGLRQIGDLLMLAGFVVLIVGLCTVNAVLLAGFICYGAGSACAVTRCVITLVKTKNHRDPTFKNAVINVCIMGVLFALAVFGIVWAAVMA